MKREYQNYLFITMGFSVLFLVFLWHFIEELQTLVWSFNNILQPTYEGIEILFFGNEGLCNLAQDIILLGTVLIMLTMIFLKIYWSVKDEKE